ncbi:hypothetical protein QMZ05_06720 [Bradyrhizobium sp. INPA03-11B]|uniref:hypothetical protein n=1 Tax=Bradyrhizobium sp. INPA03-11B TaxID=418598 RepID=UPI00338E744D
MKRAEEQVCLTFIPFDRREACSLGEAAMWLGNRLAPFEIGAFNMAWVEGSVADAAKVSSAVLAAAATRELTPSDAGEISKLIDTWVKAFETAELAERLERMTNL